MPNEVGQMIMELADGNNSCNIYDYHDSSRVLSHSNVTLMVLKHFFVTKYRYMSI